MSRRSAAAGTTTGAAPATAAAKDVAAAAAAAETLRRTATAAGGNITPAAKDAAAAAAAAAESQRKAAPELTVLATAADSKGFVGELAPSAVGAGSGATPVAMADSRRTHRLVVVTQPPDPWYNQAKGKADGFEVRVRLEGPKHPIFLVRDRLPLTVQLLYESNKLVENQSVLKVLDNAEIETSTREGTLRVRINEVSRAHQKQKFRLQIAMGALDQGVAGKFPPLTVVDTMTHPMRVLSKRARPTGSPDGAGKRKMPDDEADDSEVESVEPLPKMAATTAMNVLTSHYSHMTREALLQTMDKASILLESLQWQVIGYEPARIGAGGEMMARAIFRCPACMKCAVSGESVSHTAECPFKALLGPRARLAPMEGPTVTVAALGRSNSVRSTRESESKTKNSNPTAGGLPPRSMTPPFSTVGTATGDMAAGAPPNGSGVMLAIAPSTGLGVSEGGFGSAGFSFRSAVSFSEFPGSTAGLDRLSIGASAFSQFDDSAGGRLMASQGSRS